MQNHINGPKIQSWVSQPEQQPGNLVQRDEAGVLFMVPFVWAGSKLNDGFKAGSRAIGIRHPYLLITTLSAAAVTASGIGFAHTREGSLIESAIDTTQTVEKTTVKIDFATASDIRPAVATGTIESTRENIKMIVDTKGVDLVSDYPRNLELKGVANAEFFMPVKDVPEKGIKAALEQQINPNTNKVDLVVHMDGVTVNTHWRDSGPKVEAYTSDKKGKKDYIDDRGRREQFNKFITGFNGLVFNANGLAETMENLDEKAEADLKDQALTDFRVKCSPVFLPELKNSIKQTLPAIVESLGRSDDLGEITFKGEDAKWVPKLDPYTNDVSVGDAKGKDDTSKSVLKSTVECNYKDTTLTTTTEAGQ